jgi:hypothetical protein
MDTDIPFRSFGDALKHYREHMAERIRRLAHKPNLPAVQLSANALLACMGDAGYSLSPAGYSDIESSKSLPRDPRRFLDTVAVCLAIEPDTRDYWVLMQSLAYDLVKQKFGEDVADVVVERNPDKLKEQGKIRFK